MLSIDLHSHSLFSSCGLHTCVEMLNHAKKLGMTALAITDHGLTLDGRLNSSFFERLNDPVPGIRLLKGVECNLLEEPGAIDCPKQFLPYMDIVLLGIHHNIQRGLGKAVYTEMLLQAIEENSFLDVLAHLNVAHYDVDFESVARAAMARGMVIEINNSKCLPRKSSPEAIQQLILTCKKLLCPVIISSDAHALNEIGQDRMIRPILEDLDFPQELILNREPEPVYAFIETRRKNKQITIT
ncbi:MAG TPA: PHP domain-containing protein [Deltaproteobacteria bacterium]|nr:PHP domain-containing protein [Deltaproteobacteria bacterium]